MTDKPLTLTRGHWTFVWHGGRLMDVFHTSRPNMALDTIQAGPYNWQAGKSDATPATANRAADEWVRDYADDYERNALPYS
jgi:hypothetical protein